MRTAGRAATNRGDPRRTATPRRCSRRAGRPTPPRPRDAVCRPYRLQCVVSVPSAGNPLKRLDHDGRGVPWHVRMVPGHHGEPVAGRMRPRGAEEVVPVEQRGFARRRSVRRQGDHAAARPGRSFVVDLAHRQHPLAVRSGTQAAVAVDLPRRGRRAQGDRCNPTGQGGSGTVAEPHSLVPLVHIGEGAGGPPRHEAERAPAVLVDPAADAHPLRRVVGYAPGIGTHGHRPSRLRAGLEPVDRVTVGAQLRQ